MFFTLFLIFAVYYLNTIMIPLWGMSGAAYFNRFSLFVYNIGRMIFFYFIYKIHPFNKNQFIIIGIGILTLITCYFLNNLFINEWIQMLFLIHRSLFCSFFGSIFLFSLEKETINYTKQMKKNYLINPPESFFLISSMAFFSPFFLPPAVAKKRLTSSSSINIMANCFY